MHTYMYMYTSNKGSNIYINFFLQNAPSQNEKEISE
jgi:hypothetical protein